MLKSEIELKCPTCGIIYTKKGTEHRRNLKLNRISYCSLACAAKESFERKIPENKRSSYDISQHSDNHRDEFTPFRYYLRKAVYRKSKGESDLTLEYLKEIWDKQQGICAYSGKEMTLYTEKSQDTTLVASLDRIDSSKGYVKGNVQFVLLCLNYCKGIMTDQQMKDFILSLK